MREPRLFIEPLVATIVVMDKGSRRARMREWIAVGIREGLTFKQLAKRAGVHERTLREWNKVFRAESAERGPPDRLEDAFVKLIEHCENDASRIEIGWTEH